MTDHSTPMVKICSTTDKLPTQGTPGASGYDLHARVAVEIEKGGTAVVPVGVYLEMPLGLEAQVRGRSGLALKGIMCSLGTIDSDYRGEIGVILHNASGSLVRIERDARIAQLVFVKVEHPEFGEVATPSLLSSSDRGIGGFGSTGK